MIRLCGFRVSNYHNKVLIALREKGIPFEEDSEIHPSQKDEYLSKSPMGKVPYLEVDGTRIRESAVILEYLEEAFPQVPLLPKEPLARAKVREISVFLELHLELVVRRLYGGLFFGGSFSDETKREVEKGVAKGVRALKSVAVFDPFIAGKSLTIADCAAFTHLPIVSLVTKRAYGRDFLEDIPQVKPYLKMLGERPAFAKVNEDRKAASAAAR
ncbi:MAG TPA: glutathione S-transferase [Burkholderiales bacterium]|nr:glutathione S-transferase [Burkholderiales bacterium]